jgi:deferrochelatase/peroxidase EfeB
VPSTSAGAESSGQTPPGGIGRRGFLLAGIGSVGALASGCSLGSNGEAGADSGVGSSQQAQRVPFAGQHQPTIVATPVAGRSALASFKVLAPGREELRTMFADLSTTIADLMAGRLPEQRGSAYPPAETGVLGAEIRPDHLGIVVSVGASLFDERYGLADRKPTELVEMPFLSNDRLDPARSHGDVLISIEADHEDTVQHALRQVMRATRRYLLLSWTLGGYSRGVGPVESETPRNLMGFKDGTANLDISDADLMDRHVWVGPDDDEPAWAVGGSYHVVRVIRMLVEFWDRTRLGEQEAIIGRHKVSGAPLGSEDEFGEISFADDPDGVRTPLDAHVRLANPRTPDTEDDRLLRRGFSFARGVDAVGQLDQGLAFVSYQRQLRQFLAVQSRLDGEPLEEYILPVGGGFFFALPGPKDETTSLAAGLLS